MNKEKIQEFINLAKENKVTSLSYKEGDVELSVTFEKEVSTQLISPSQNLSAPISRDSNSQASSTSGHQITSPLVGTFYESAAPGQKAFVQVGDKVTNGQVLCIVEAMKIMNEIESDTNGIIKEIKVVNEDFIEFGQTLFVIEKS